jgi:hypothetical protein
MMEWICRTVERDKGLQTCGPHSVTLQPAAAQSCSARALADGRPGGQRCLTVRHTWGPSTRCSVNGLPLHRTLQRRSCA